MGSFFEWSGDDEGRARGATPAPCPVLESLVASDPRNADARLLLAEAYNSVGYGSRSRAGPPRRSTILAAR